MKYLLCYCIFFPFLSFGQSTAFDIAGTIKTVEKVETTERKGVWRDVEIDEDSKVLQMHVRRTNPTVSGNVRVSWVVLMKDFQGQVKAVTEGDQQMALEVGIPTSIQSDAFSIVEKSLERRRRHDRKVEQEIEGYAVLIYDLNGNELGAKFQPKSLEDRVRKALAKRR